MPQPLPPELARRIEALRSRSADEDFDRSSWVWLALLGGLLPVALILIGWVL